LPGTFDLVDIRPPEAFQDYALPGSINTDPADVLSNAVYLTGAGPLIIVDRDGSLAMMVAGILSQKTKRPIKALYGGLDGLWEETELKRAVRSVPLPATAPGVQAAPAGSPALHPATPKPAPTAPSVPKKKSAGC
jgi:rhodanese-related sulfurtransferase